MNAKQRRKARRTAPEQVELAQSTTSKPVPPLGHYTPQILLSRWDKLQPSELRFSDLLGLMEQAERGIPKRWADLTRRILKTDPDLASVVNTRIDGVVCERWELVPPDGLSGQGEVLAERAVQLCTQVLQSLHDFEQVQRDLLDGIGMGYSVAELVWGRVPCSIDGAAYHAWGPVEMPAIHPRRLCFTESFELALLEQYFDRHIGGERIWTRAGRAIRLPPDRYVVHRPRYLLDYPTASGLFMAIARYWWVKQWVIRYWLAGAERLGNGRWVGVYPQQATDGVKRDLLTAIEQLAGDGSAVMAKETEIKLLEGNFSGSAAVWEGLVNHMNKSYAKAWLGSDLNVEVGSTGGNRSLGESQADTTIDPRKERDSRALWADLRRCVLEPICRYNAKDPNGIFGGVMPPVPMGRHVFVEEHETIDAVALEAECVTKGEVRRSRNLPLFGDARDNEIATATKVTQQSAGAPAGSPPPPSTPSEGIGGR